MAGVPDVLVPDDDTSVPDQTSSESRPVLADRTVPKKDAAPSHTPAGAGGGAGSGPASTPNDASLLVAMIAQRIQESNRLLEETREVFVSASDTLPSNPTTDSRPLSF